MTSVEPLSDTNYIFPVKGENRRKILWKPILWKKAMGVQPPIKPQPSEEEYNEKFIRWNERDDDNHSARVNMMSKAQVLKCCNEKYASNLWNAIKYNMTTETEQMKAKRLCEITNLRMRKC